MNCSEDMKRQRYKAKKSQWFRRMFTVALLMGVLIGFLMVKIPVWLTAPEPETKAVLFGTYQANQQFRLFRLYPLPGRV